MNLGEGMQGRHTKVPEEEAGVVGCRDIGEEVAGKIDVAAVGLDAGGGLADRGLSSCF